MFINLSNHPLESWLPEQKEAAGKWGKLVDLPFPLIPLEMSGKQVEEIARGYLEKIKLLIPYPDNGSAIHVVGEPAFTFFMVSLLLAEGYEVVVATTHRNTVMHGDTKISIFRFVQFRPYYLPCVCTPNCKLEKV